MMSESPPGGARSASSFSPDSPWPFFPFFFLLFPFLHFWSVNYEKELEFHKLLPSFGLAIVLTSGIWFVLGLWMKSRLRASLAVFLMVFIFFSYGHFYLLYLGNLPLHPRLISGFFILLFFVAPFFMMLVPLPVKASSSRFFVSYLNLFAVLVCFFPLRNIYFQRHEISPFTLPVLEGELPEFASKPDSLPDIYYIILDEYGRSDILQKTFGFDNTAFLQDLEKRGFYVAKASHSNYPFTIDSLPSSLNFEYLEPGLSEGPLSEKIKAAKIIFMMKKFGYRYVFVNSGATMTQSAPLADQRISYWGADDVSITFVNSTLLRAYSVFLLSESWRARHLYNFRELKKLPAQPEPKFVFAHLLIPHPPMVFKRDGSLYGGITTSFTPRGWIKASADRYREGYPGQLEYLNVLLKDLVETLLKESKTPPVIILQSDHGIDPLTDSNYESDEAIYKRMANFTAVYASPEVLKKFYSQITPVNIFRILLDGYFGTKLGLLDDRQFIPVGLENDLLGFEEVTERIRQFESRRQI